ncbi:hypothetical protein QUF74_12565 [Candidatus Halobeggiatoa sp. HSG11]|nr:hypothetical protein [Candidatus Halobeggiatoa sp. HSG11]
MAYSDFNLKKLQNNFGLIQKNTNLFEDIKPLILTDWLQQTLEMGLDLAISSSSKKARSEFIVTPILLELRKANNNQIAIYSGENLDVDAEAGLKGECDFILAKGERLYTIQNPIFALLEAKKNDIGSGLGQCTAQMLGARLFNQQENNDIDTIFGCVTTGEIWQFLKLEEDVIHIDSKCYYINDLEMILGIFQNIIDYNNVTKS